MHIQSEAYATHEVFQKIEAYASFYDQLGTAVLSWMPAGTSAITNIDTYAYSSMEGTLRSIGAVLKLGHINDAYALLRSYHESIFLNLYAAVFLSENRSSHDRMVQSVEEWVQGRASLPEFRVLSSYLRSAQGIKPISDMLFEDDRYTRIRKRCNQHTHYGFYQHVLLNDSRIHNPARGRWLARILADASSLFLFHIACTFRLNDHYMMSGDYVDALDCGMKPEAGSENWVAPFVQEMLNLTVRKERPEIYDALRGSTSMALE